MYESLGNQLLADANGFGKEIAERILVEKSWPSQAQVTVAHDIVEGNNTCHLVKARLSSGEPILRIQDSENKIWEARLQDGWLFRGILEGKKVQTREAKTFLKKLNAKHSTAFVKMVEHCMVDLIEAHQSKVKPIHEVTERFGPYHLPMTEAFMGYELDESAEISEGCTPLELKCLRDGKAGHQINKQMFSLLYRKGLLDDRGRLTRNGEQEIAESVLSEGNNMANKKMAKGMDEIAKGIKNYIMNAQVKARYLGDEPLSGHSINVLIGASDKSDLKKIVSAISHFGKKFGFKVATGARPFRGSSFGGKSIKNDSDFPLYQIGLDHEMKESSDLKEADLKLRDVKLGSVLVNKRNGREVTVKSLRKAPHVKGGYGVSLKNRPQPYHGIGREDNVDIDQVLKNYNLKESSQENKKKITEFSEPVEIPFGAIVDYQGREYKKLQLTDKPIWRQEKLADKRQKELGTDIVKGDKNYDQIEKRAKMQLRSKKLFDPKKLPTDIKTKYRILAIKMLKAPTAMKRKFQDEIDALLKNHLNPGFSPMTDSVTEAAEKDIWTVSVRLVWQGFVIFAGGQEGTTDNETTLTFNFANEEDAKEAASVANGFHATDDVRIEQDKGTGYPAFKRDLFLKILDNTVDPKIHKTIKAYKRGRFRKRRY